MTYRVVYTQNVRADIAAHVKYLQEQEVSPETIEDWFARLFDEIDGLYKWPLRHPIAEAETRERGFEIRKMLFDHYHIFYRVDQDRGLVEVLSFHHGARRFQA